MRRKLGRGWFFFFFLQGRRRFIDTEILQKNLENEGNYNDTLLGSGLAYNQDERETRRRH
jgi:hypothetical protein